MGVRLALLGIAPGAEEAPAVTGRVIVVVHQAAALAADRAPASLPLPRQAVEVVGLWEWR